MQAFLPLLRLATLRTLEAASVAKQGHLALIEKAGAAAFKHLPIAVGERVLLLIGPGNNGADGLVLARLLHNAGHSIRVVLLADATQLGKDAKTAYQTFVDAGGKIDDALPSTQTWDWGVDALFGVGLNRPIEGDFAEAIHYLNQYARRILALDIPSGLSNDTGIATGPVVRATQTVTFLAHKPGLFTGSGAAFAGDIVLDSLGTEPINGDGMLIAQLPTYLKPRRADTHKGDFGRVGILGGADGMVGAGLIAARGAQQLGAGRVHLACLAADAPTFDSLAPQIMFSKPEALLALPLTALAVGPGLGQSETAASLLYQAAHLPIPLVLDADALNLLADSAEIRTVIAKRSADTLITPHPKEAARLLKTTVEHIQSDRIASACHLAESLGAWVVLKGAGSIVASPSGDWWINRSGNAGLASAGTGDLLVGMLLAMLAQGLGPKEALLSATALHGAAADQLALELGGLIGFTTDELLHVARQLLNRKTYEKL